jgi:hypothetical protein
MTRPPIARQSRKQTPLVDRARVNDEDVRITEELACKAMGWKPAPDRFFKSGRSWIPRWRFRPFEEIGDAFQSLDAVASGYTLVSNEGESFRAEVRVKGRVGQACGDSRARAIATATWRALGLEGPDAMATSVSTPARRRSRRSRRRGDDA